VLKKVLIADSDLSFFREISEGLGTKGVSTDHVSFGKDAQSLLNTEKYYAVLLNYNLANFSSIEVLNYIKTTNPFLRVFMIFDDLKSLDETGMQNKKSQFGLADVFLKPSERERLLYTLTDSGADKNWAEVSEDMSSKTSPQQAEALSLEDSEFFCFKIDHIVEEGFASFDLYIRLDTGRYLLLVRKGETLPRERVMKYADVKYLFYKCSDRRQLLKNLTKELDSSMSSISENPKKVSNLLRKSMGLVFDEIATNGPREQELGKAKDLIIKTLDVVKAIPDLQVLFDEFISDRELIKTHSLLSCVFTAVICQNVEWLSAKVVEEVCLGAYFQNIGLSRLKKDTLEPDDTFSEMEKEIFSKHPINGYRFLLNYPVSEKVRQIVLQHHERCDGKGYPFGLRLMKIYPPAKIVFIASELSELMLKHRLNPKEAVTKIVQTIDFREKYDPKLIRSLILGFINKKRFHIKEKL